jgi:hypothetical protein
MKYYHMIVEPIGNWPGETTGRKEYINTTQGAAPPGYKCVGVCGYHEKPRQVQYPCRGCVYYAACGSSMRTAPCDGRKTKSDLKKET